MLRGLSENRKGEWYIGLEILLWAFFPIITVLSFSNIPSLVALAWSSFFTGIFFFFLMIYRNKWGELKSFLLWKYVLGVTFLERGGYFLRMIS